MNPQKQRIAIAEASGFKLIQATKDEAGGLYRPDGRWITKFWTKDVSFHFVDIISQLPDYLNDLNACHEMEKILDSRQKGEYGAFLVQRLRDEEDRSIGEELSQDWPLNEWGYYALLRTTASQRCEAFLKTIGKWEKEE